MDEILFNLGAGLAFGVIVLEKGIGLVKFLWTDKNKKGVADNKQEVEIALIKQDLHILRTNEMVHLKKQMEDNAEDHQKIFVALAEIKALLK